jgi:hypothetical protein
VTSSDARDSDCVPSGSVRAACDVCGQWPPLLHFPRQTHGCYCAACCPVCTTRIDPAKTGLLKQAFGGIEAAEVARLYFGADQLERAERLAKIEAESDFRDRLYLAAYEALQVVTGDLNPRPVIPDDKLAVFYAEFARRLP